LLPKPAPAIADAETPAISDVGNNITKASRSDRNRFIVYLLMVFEDTGEFLMF
jgi:hypothetical protein